MRVIEVNKNTGSAILYGLDNSNVDYFRDKYNVLKSNMVETNTINMTHGGFYNDLNYLNSENYIKDIKETLFSLDIAGNDNVNIYYYHNPAEANRITTEYIMANPKLQSLYNRGLIDGYSDNYVHNDGDAYAKYASVMNGENHGNDDFVTYIDDNLIELSEDDKRYVKETWERCLQLLKDDTDPTLR